MRRARAFAVSTVLGAAVAVSTAGVAFAEGPGFGRDFDHGRHGGGLLMVVLLLAAVGALVAVLWRGRHPAPAASVTAPPASPTLNAQSILAERLARGEISPDDYRAAITVLRETSPPT